MLLNPKQQKVKQAIENFASLLDVDPNWACAIAMVESSLGDDRISRTGSLGIFQMSTVAMADLRQDDDDVTQILCGLLFMRLLYRRWGTIEEATNHFCDPADRDFYLERMLGYYRTFKQQIPPAPVAAEYPANKQEKSWWERLWG